MLDPHVEPVGFEDDKTGRTAVTVHQVVRDLTGKVLVDQTIQHVYTIRDGLIERMEIREPAATYVDSNEFWGRKILYDRLLIVVTRMRGRRSRCRMVM